MLGSIWAQERCEHGPVRSMLAQEWREMDDATAYRKSVEEEAMEKGEQEKKQEVGDDRWDPHISERGKD